MHTIPQPRHPLSANEAARAVFQQAFFNLDDASQGMQRELAPGITTRIFPGEHAMLSVVRLEPGAEGDLHQHPEEQWGVLLEGSALRFQGGVELAVRKGDFWRTPGNVPHRIKAGREGAVILDVFSPPRDDYRRPGVGFGGADASHRSVGR